MIVPTCVLAGEFDLLMPLQQSADLAQQVPDALLKIVKGAAHSVHTEQPEVFVQLVVAFLNPALIDLES